MARLKDWMALSAALHKAALELFFDAELGETDAADLRVVGLALLARTHSNLKGIVLLVGNKRVVEARTLARCCLENAFWVAGLVKDGEKFRRLMLHDEIKHRKKRGEFIFEKQLGLEAEMEEKLREWMRSNRHWGNSDALNPQKVAEIGDLAKAYIFYAELSADAAHPSVEALSRYVPEEGVLDMEPVVDDEELCQTMRETCMAVISVLVGVNELLGSTEAGKQLEGLAKEYMRLLGLEMAKSSEP